MVVFRNLRGLPQEKKRKYRNEPVIVDGIKFDSKKEGRRYEELLMQVKAGLISNLKVKPIFKITINGQFLCNYIADFSYEEIETRDLGKTSIHQVMGQVVEDTKGKDPKSGWDTRTPVYNLKKRLMRIILGIEVRET